MIVGYLCDGKFRCDTCMRELHLNTSSPTPISVTTDNLSFYSQWCSKCRTLVREGKVETELFPTGNQTDEFRWTDMQQLLVKFDKALEEDDLEVVTGTKLEMYERVLKAIRVHGLHNAEMVMDALGRVMRVVTRW